MELSTELLQSLAKNQDPRLEYLVAAVNAAKKAAEIIRPALEIKRTFETKDRAVDLVTETDKKVEKCILSLLREQFPTHKFIGEESVSGGASCTLTNDPTWMVDPIDGTTSFVHGFPYFAVSIGLAIDKRAQVGVVYAITMEEMYVAVEGHGSYLGSERLHVTNHKSLKGAMIVTEFGAWRKPEELSFITKNICTAIGLKNGPANGLRCLGSAALDVCIVGRGTADAYFERGPHCWDMAAGVVIAKEAGAIIGNFLGEGYDLMKRDVVCASSKELFDQIRGCIDTTGL